MRRILLATLILVACNKVETPVRDAATEPMALDATPAPGDAPVSLAVDFAVEGCPDFDSQALTCTGQAPLTLRFVPLSTTTVTKYLWSRHVPGFGSRAEPRLHDTGDLHGPDRRDRCRWRRGDQVARGIRGGPGQRGGPFLQLGPAVRGRIVLPLRCRHLLHRRPFAGNVRVQLPDRLVRRRVDMRGPAHRDPAERNRGALASSALSSDLLAGCRLRRWLALPNRAARAR